MTVSFIRNTNGFPVGYTSITEIGEPIKDTGINFGILKLTAGEEITIDSRHESAYLLLNGDVIISHDQIKYRANRQSLFEQEPVAVHFSAHKMVSIKAMSEVEFAVMETINIADFPTLIFDHTNMLESEHRGKGVLNDTSYRIVRTIFDTRNRPESKLVLGEVINFPGCWSSYPPHHHKQPEIYHYRFTEKNGYGHGELDDQIFKTENYSTLKILDEQDHAQAAAPGYGMYYMWVIRHLPGNPYIQPEFTEAHNWTRTTNANERVWLGSKEDILEVCEE